MTSSRVVVTPSVLAFESSLLDPSVESVQWQLERDPALADPHILPTHIHQLLIHRFLQEWFSQQVQISKASKAKSATTSSMKQLHRLSQIRWNGLEGEANSYSDDDNDDDEMTDPATFTPQEMIEFFYAISNMHDPMLQVEFERVLIEFKRQLILDRVAHDRPVSEIHTWLRHFFPLAFPSSSKKQQQFDDVAAVWLHEPSGYARELEEAAVKELKALLDNASPAAVDAYMSRYFFTWFVISLNSYLTKALDAWKLKHIRAKSPVPTRVAATTAAPVSAEKEARATPSSSSAKKAAAMRKATAAWTAAASQNDSSAAVVGSSLSSGLSSVTKSLELPLTQASDSTPIALSSQESKTKRNSTSKSGGPAALGEWRWDGLVLNVTEVESLLLPAMLEGVSDSQIEAQLSPDQEEEGGEPMSKEEKTLFKRKRALLDSIHSQKHEQIVRFLKQRKPIAKAASEEAVSVSVAHNQKPQGEMKIPTPSKRKRKFEEAVVTAESKEAVADEADEQASSSSSSGHTEQQKRKQKKVQQHPTPPRDYGRVTRSNSNGSGMSSKPNHPSPASKKSAGKRKNKRLIESEADFLLTQQPIPSSDVEEDDDEEAYEDDEDEEMEDSEATPKRSDPIQPIRIATNRGNAQGIASYFKPQPKSNTSTASPSTRSKRASR